MRIEGQQNRLYSGHQRLDNSHRTPKVHGDNEQRGKTTSLGSTPTRSAADFLSGVTTDLLDKIKQVPEVRAERVQFIAERVRQGFYSTADAAAQTAAEIVKSPEPLDIDQA